MPLRTYQSDQAEKRAAEGKGSNPLPYLGGLFALGALGLTLARARWALPLVAMVMVGVLVLGATGRLAFMTPLWDAVRDWCPV